MVTLYPFSLQLYLGAGFNVVGAVLRWVSCSPSIICSPHYALSGYLVAMTGQIFTACAQPFLLYAPTKLASFWFGPKERAFCTMLSSLGNPVGLGLAQLISPHVVSSLDNFSTLVRGWSHDDMYISPLAATALDLHLTSCRGSCVLWHCLLVEQALHPPSS